MGRRTPDRGLTALGGPADCVCPANPRGRTGEGGAGLWEGEAVADLTRLLRVLWDAYNDELDEAAGAAFEDLCAEYGLDADWEWARLDDERYRRERSARSG